MKKSISIFILFFIPVISFSQSVSVNADGSSPDPSAILDVKSTGKGFLLPRMSSTQRTAIANPAPGLKVFDTNTKSFWFYNGTGWIESATGSAVNFWTQNGSDIFNNNSGNIGIGNNNPDYKLTLFSNVIQANSNTQLLSLRGQNPIFTFADQNNISIGYLKAWTYNPYAPFTNGLVIGSSPGYPIFLSTNNYSASMTVADNGDVGIGTTLPDARLSLYSSVVASNDNTTLLSLHGRNPVISFTDENNVGYGYIKSWTHSPYAPFTNGMVIGSTPGYPIFFSTNNYSLSMMIADNGNVGIGTSNPTYKLSVNGNVRSKEVVVESNWADYVFDEEYQLPKLDDVEQFVLQNKHLPDIPTAGEIKKNGLSVGDTQTKMMQKIEELTLYVIDLQKQIDQLKNEKNEKR